MPKYSTSSLYSNTHNDNRCRIHEEKAELKRRLQQVQRCEAEAEINRKKRAEQWRQLVLKEERVEHERKRKIEKLQKLIDKEMQRKHRRHHTDVNSANSSTHITEQPPVEIDSTEQTAPPLTSTVDEEPSTIIEKTDESSITTTVQADSPDDITIAETDSPDDITVAETDSPDDITVAEIDSPDDITVAETDNHDDITTAETDNHNDITTAETDNHDDITTAEKDNHDDITKELSQRTPVNTELQITALEVRRNTDRQEMSLDQTLEVCIAQECVSGDIVQSEHAHANLSDEQLQNSEENRNVAVLKVHHDTDLQKKAMQRTLRMCIAQECASDTQVPQSLRRLKILLGDSEVREMVYVESRDIVISCQNSCLCFKFLWWQDGLLMS